MTVEYTQEEHVTIITLNRPEKLNAIDLETWQNFGEATERFLADENAWVAIVTGSGERAFCAGADIGSTLKALVSEPGEEPYKSPATIMRGQEVFKPIIAAINGIALGGGFEVVLACDIRIAVEGARFGCPEVTLGLIPGWGGTQRLARELPWALASRLVLTGELINAEEALGYGLLNALVKSEDLMPEARRIAGVLCSRGPLALQAAKKAMVKGRSISLEAGLAIEDEIFFDVTATADAKEGVAAFLEKRAPNFVGR